MANPKDFLPFNGSPDEIVHRLINTMLEKVEIALLPGEKLVADARFPMHELKDRPGYVASQFIVIENIAGNVVDIQVRHLFEDAVNDTRSYWLPNYRPPDHIMKEIEIRANYKFPDKIWNKNVKWLV